MKIVIFNWRDIKNPNAGGAEILTHELAKRFVAQGHDVTLFSSHFPKGKKRDVVDGVVILREGEPDLRALHHSVHYHAYRYYKKYLKGHVDVVIDEIHGMPFFTRFYVKEQKIAFICEVAKDIWDKMYPFPWNIIGKTMERIILFLYRGINFTTISESTKQDLISYGIPKDAITVLPMGFRRIAIKNGKKQVNPTAIFVARINKMKGIEDAIQAWRIVVKRYPKAMLWVVGKGEEHYLAFLRKKIRANHMEKNIHFWDFVSEKKKFQLMARAHVLISPSVREGFGLTIPEAGSVGTPAIVYDVPGLRDIVDDTNGIKLKKNTPEELAKELIAFFKDKERQQQLGRQAKKKSLQYNWETTAKVFLQKIQSS